MVNEKIRTFRDAAETLIDMEVRLRLLDGYSLISKIWERIRFRVFKIILIKLDLDDLAHIKYKPENKIFRVFKKLISCFYYFFVGNPFFSFRKPEYLFISNQRRKINSRGLFDDIYTDPLVELMRAGNPMCIEAKYDGKHLRPSRTESLFFFDFIETIINIRKKFCKVIIDNKDLSKINIIEREIMNLFNINISLRELFGSEIRLRECSLGIYCALLKHLKPRIIFLVCSYDKENLIEAAKSIGIKTVEIQHGVLNRYHLGYSFPNGLKKVSFPDYFLGFGKFWLECTEFPIPKVRQLVLGFPYLSESLKSIVVNKQKKILIISQDNVGNKIEGFTRKIIAEYGEKYKVTFKLHPAQYLIWKNSYPDIYELHNKGLLEVVDSDMPSLYQLQAESEFQIGVNSTALFEGMALMCKTVILKISGYEYMQSLIDNNYVLLYDLEDELDLSRVPVVNIDPEYFFSMSYEDNFKKNLEVIEDDNDEKIS